MTHYENPRDLPDDPNEMNAGDTVDVDGVSFQFIGGDGSFSVLTLREFLSSAMEAAKGALEEFDRRTDNEEGQLAVVTQYHSAMDNFVHMNAPLLSQYVLHFLGQKAVTEAETFLSTEKGAE